MQTRVPANKRTAALRSGRAFLMAALLFGLASCSSSKDSTPSTNSPVQTYTIRGQVMSVPVPDNPASELMIRHEAVPGFVNRSGEMVTMETMTMGFTPAKDVSLESIKPGDKVEFVLSVDWPADRIQITRIETLPEETKLEFGG